MAEQTNAQGATQAPEKKAKKKNKRNVPTGKVFIQSGFGNTIVTFTDVVGNTICWSSAGMLGFKGSRKGTPFAAQMAAEDASRKALESGFKQVDLFLNGPGAGREPAVRAIAASGIRVLTLKDVTPVPHNGCRPPKRRRI